MIKELRVEGIDAQELLVQFRLIAREEAEAALKKDYSEKLLSAEASRKCFDPVISRGTFHNYVSDGLISYLTINGTKWYKLSDIIAAGERIKRYSPAKSKL